MGKPFDHFDAKDAGSTQDAGPSDTGDVNLGVNYQMAPEDASAYIRVDSVQELETQLGKLISDADATPEGNPNACLDAYFNIGEGVFPGFQGGLCYLEWQDSEGQEMGYRVILKEQGYVHDANSSYRVVNPNEGAVAILTKCYASNPGCDTNSITEPLGGAKIKLSDTFAIAPEGGVSFAMQSNGKTDEFLLRGTEGTGKIVIYKNGEVWHELEMPGVTSSAEVEAILDIAASEFRKVEVPEVPPTVNYDEFGPDDAWSSSDALTSDGDAYTPYDANPHNVGGPSIGSAGDSLYRSNTGCDAGPKKDSYSQPLSAAPLLTALIAVAAYQLATRGAEGARKKIGDMVRNVAGKNGKGSEDSTE